MAETKRPDRPKPPAPQSYPFDLDAKNLGGQQIEDDEEILLAEPMTR